MNTFLKISWRNIYRNPRRTFILAVVIAISYLGMMFMQAFMDGYLGGFLDSLINSHMSHMQIHEKGFNANPVIKKRMKEPTKIEQVLKQHASEIKAYTPRVKNQGIINSSESSSGIMIVGIDPEREARVSNIKTLLSEGEYLEKDDDLSIYIGQALAKKLKVELGDKIVLMGQTIHYEVGGFAYRIKGIYKSNSPAFEKGMAFITIGAAQSLFEMDKAVSEFAMLVHHPDTLSQLQQSIKDDIQSDDIEVLKWTEIMANIAQMLEMSSNVMYIFQVIILIFICFSIINTLFVVVFERFKEFGIMKALGTRPKHIFMLIVFEALGMTLIGLVFGGILTAMMMGYFANYGLDFTAYSKGLSIIGMGGVLYLTLSLEQIVSSIILTFVIVTLAAMYPATVAARIQPVKALKFV